VLARLPRIEMRHSLAWVIVALAALHTGCSSPTAPPDPPGGGTVPSLSFEAFEQSIEPILARQGSDAGGDCHGGGIRGSLALSPRAAKDTRFDFDQVALQVSATSPTASPILTEPLAVAAGGTAHGIEPFASTDDPDYQAILAWIVQGTAP